MSSLPAIDHEVIELLGELARAPDSRLLRVSPDGFRRWLDATERPLSAREPFLSRSERYLLQEHREQVAFLLYKACQRALLGLPLWESMVHRNATGLEVTVPEDAWFDAQVEALSGFTPADDVTSDELLRHLPARNRAASIASSLAIASLQIAPRDEARIWLALALLSEKKFEAGQEVLQAVLAHRPTELISSLAEQNLGFSRLLESDPRAAAEHYRQACSIGPPRPTPTLAWLHAAMLSADRRDTIDAAQHLTELISEDSVDVQEHIGIWEERKRKGLFHPPPSSNVLARELIHQLSPVATRVIHVFVQP